MLTERKVSFAFSMLRGIINFVRGSYYEDY